MKIFFACKLGNSQNRRGSVIGLSEFRTRVVGACKAIEMSFRCVACYDSNGSLPSFTFTLYKTGVFFSFDASPTMSVHPRNVFHISTTGIASLPHLNDQNFTQRLQEGDDSLMPLLNRERENDRDRDRLTSGCSAGTINGKVDNQGQMDGVLLNTKSQQSSWFRGRAQKQVQVQSTPAYSTISEDENDSDHLKEMYQRMLGMTNELVDDLYLNLRAGNQVLTRYGKGTIQKKEPTPCNAVSLSSTKIQLDWGAILNCPQSDFVHKLLSPEEYAKAIEHLEEIRKLHLSIQCLEWGIKQQADEACVACLFHKPELYSSTRTRQKRQYSWRSNSTGSSLAPDSSTASKKTCRCDVCGNPVCSQHKIAMDGGDVEFFTMCVDCSHDLNQTELNLNAHHPQLLQNLQRLVQYYTRMRLQLCFCVPNFAELGHQLTHKQQRDGAISLGNSALGFVGAALGVAGAAAMLTPAGPAILLAAVATSATSGTFQSMHASYNKFLSSKTAHQLADRCLGWHGLCLGILNALEALRQDLIVQEHDFVLDHQDDSTRDKSSKSAPKQQSMEIWNALAVGSFSTTRSAMTGVSVTSAMGASYSQAINTSLQGIPVVGAAFSVGCMAMDANNMAASVKLLSTPAQKAVALQGVEQSFIRRVPTTIAPNVIVIMKAVDDLHLRMAEQRHEEERALIEQELEGLGGTLSMDSDSDIERELSGL